MSVAGSIWSGVKKVGKVLPVIGPIAQALDQPDPAANDAQADAVKDRAREVADKAAADLAAAQGRHTDPGKVDAVQAEGGHVGVAPINPGETVQHAGGTAAPTIAPVGPVVAATVVNPAAAQGIGDRVAGSPAADQANRTSLVVDQGGRGYQDQAAAEMAAILRGERPSVAQEQLRATQDRTAAEQLSIAAGARGQGVASARRNAANNISLQQVEAGGQAAQLRAQEIAAAAQGLGQVGGQVQGQSVTEGSNRAQVEQTTELANTKARNDAIQSAQERRARGEITEAQLQTEIAKANADYQQRTGEKNQDAQKDVAIEHARQQLQADLASDERLQQSFNLEAQLKAEAAKGNQDAAVKLQALQAQIDTDIDKFNANQIQTANASNIANRLQALHLDDTFVANMTQAWLQAEAQGNQAAIAALQIKLKQAVDLAAMNKDWHDQLKGDIEDAGKAIAGAKAPKGSDRRLKKDIREVSPEAIDEFLRTVGANKSWRYKDPADGKGDQVGPMAQDVERSELGRSAVSRRGDGMRTVDYSRMAALALAGAARLSDRLDQVEGGKKRRAPPDVAGFARARRSA